MYKYVRISQVGPIRNNIYLVYNEQKETIIIDPSFGFEKIRDEVKKLELKVTKILLTHLHYDHYYDLQKCMEYYDLDTYYCHLDDLGLITNITKEQESQFIEYFKERDISLDLIPFLKEKMTDIYHFDWPNVEIYHTPGHSPGSTIINFDNQFMISGDTIFREVYGLTNLIGSSHQSMIESCIKIFSLNLPDNILMLPGHGAKTKLGYERKNNLILKDINAKDINW
jgi:hydroxyacylglutathione hydrolase